ncbi:MAG: helix-hairpin-helix domain-containing protein [Bacteroidota bacterium]|nr:helix-hairpin-helix domain-containing protein [Bacteroidota bacterium]
MNESKPNRLEILVSEKRKLRAEGIKLNEIHRHSVRSLKDVLNVSGIRAMELRAMSEFQSLPSIGAKFAHDLIQLGFYSLHELKGKDPAKLFNKLELLAGAWIDPCVEDQFRLVVHFAEHPESPRNWWDFTHERKKFRQDNGYPSTRPAKPWFELDQYKTVNRVQATGKETKADLHKRMRLAVNHMKDHLDEDITLETLSRVCHISPFHFLRLFKSAYEATPREYLTRLRLKKACRLLKKTKRPVGLIMVSCGFENQSSFIRLFKKEFKVTPLAFRRAHSATIN